MTSAANPNGTKQNKALFTIFTLLSSNLLNETHTEQLILQQPIKKSLFQNLFGSTVYLQFRLQLNTFTIPIRKRFRGRNKPKIELPSGFLITLTQSKATQTDEISILGQGRRPLMNKQQFNPFTKIEYDNPLVYLKLFYKVIGERFIVQATRSNSQSKTPIPNTLEHYSRDWHSLTRELSKTPTGCILYDGRECIRFLSQTNSES